MHEITRNIKQERVLIESGIEGTIIYAAELKKKVTKKVTECDLIKEDFVFVCTKFPWGEHNYTMKTKVIFQGQESEVKRLSLLHMKRYGYVHRKSVFVASRSLIVILLAKRAQGLQQK